jgi:Protein of unknown function (DUF4232)
MPTIRPALALALLLAGCGSAATPHAAAPAMRAAAPAPCRAGSLRVTVDGRQAGGTAGSTYYPVDFTNLSGTACTMDGYPGVSFVTSGDGAGRQIGAAARQDPAFGTTTIHLGAGGAAHAWLQVAAAGNYPPSACRPVRSHWLRVLAPGQAVPRFVSYALDACASAQVTLLTVMPVRAGQGIQGRTP